MAFEVRIPSLGESITEAVIARWLKQDGESVSADDALVELETDKANMELPAGAAGVVRIVQQQGATVGVGDVVARIEEGAGRPASRGNGATQPAPMSASPTSVATIAAAAETAKAAGLLSPAVRSLVVEHGIDPTAIQGSGKGGRLTKEDVLAYLAKPPTGAIRPGTVPPVVPAAPAPVARPAPPAPVRPPGEGEEAVPMSNIRKRIATRLVEAQHRAAILTTFNEIDMSGVMALRTQHKEAFQKKHGIGLGFMSFFARACVSALQDIPAVNAEIRGEQIIYKHFVHLGIAVGTPRGLVVPVVKHAERMGFAEIEREIGRLAGLARESKLTLDDLSGGTFTISNGGTYGSLLSTPILNPPQSGILGMHKIEKRPVVIEDQIVIRPMMYVALSYDHRLIDGEQAVTFLVRIKERIENPTRLLLEV